MMAQQPENIKNIPIDHGTRPDFNLRFGYPSILNTFIGKSRSLYHSPSLQLLVPLIDIRDFLYSTWNGGYYFVITNTQVLRVSLDGIIGIIHNITYSGLGVQICANQNNQIAFCDGRWGYIYDQSTNDFRRSDSIENFVIENPIAVTCINNFFVFLGSVNGVRGAFQPSAPNNGFMYNPLQVATISSNLTKPIGMATLINNLYIFGSTGIERWVGITSNIYSFPLTKDPNFRADYGAISTNSIINAINNIYFISNKRTPMVLSPEGLKEVPSDQDMAGFSNLISNYSETDLNSCSGTFYSFNGEFFYHMTFPEKGISWVYCENSDRLSLSDDLILAAAQNNQIVATKTGLYTLSNIASVKHRQFISDRLISERGIATKRNLLNGIEFTIIQGYSQPTQPQYLNLSLSLDSQSWTNSVPVQIGLTGQRNNITKWNCNVAFPRELTIKLDYYGDYNFNIEKIAAIIN